MRLMVAGWMLIASGCTVFQPPVERRISRNQEIFEAFPLEVQEKLRQGKIHYFDSETRKMIKVSFTNKEIEEIKNILGLNNELKASNICF